jgi:hypothetical protein
MSDRTIRWSGDHHVYADLASVRGLNPIWPYADDSHEWLLPFFGHLAFSSGGIVPPGAVGIARVYADQYSPEQVMELPAGTVFRRVFDGTSESPLVQASRWEAVLPDEVADPTIDPSLRHTVKAC